MLNLSLSVSEPDVLYLQCSCLFFVLQRLFTGGSRAAATSKMERFVIIVNGWKPLTIFTKHSILDVAAALDPPLLFLSKTIVLNWPLLLLFFIAATESIVIMNLFVKAEYAAYTGMLQRVWKMDLCNVSLRFAIV